MIDLQTHFLPGWGDGPPDEETALEMLRLAAETGTREIVAAPRTDLSVPFDAEAADAMVAKLQLAVGHSIHLHRGAIVELNWRNLETALEDPGRYSINGRRYLLLKLGDDVLMRGTGKLLQRFTDLGVTPILTGIERKPTLRRDRRRLRGWISNGVRVQLSAAALLGDYGERAQRAAARLIDSGLAHFICSDGRNLSSRPPRLSDAYDYVVYRWGESRAERLFIDNPWPVLWGLEPTQPVVKRRARTTVSIPALLGIEKLFQPKKKKKRRRRRRSA